MSDANAYRVGDRIRVVDAGAGGTLTFGDYENGDTATVKHVDGGGWVEVTWDHRRSSNASEESGRCSLLAPGEFEPLAHCVDANLIAAAPKLLAACELLIQYDELDADLNVEMMLAYGAAVSAARAAIAKATGAQA